MAHTSKVPVIRRSTHWVWLESHNGVLWVHADVLKWNKTTKQQMDVDWANFTGMINSDLYVLYNPRENKPKAKFIKFYGFGYYKTITGKDGNEYQIWYRRK